jgi:hypothetical protein
MSLKTRLRTIFMCAALELGMLSGFNVSIVLCITYTVPICIVSVKTGLCISYTVRFSYR